MIGHQALWHKSWLESRTRFICAAALMFLVVSWDILDSEHGMSRFDKIPPITFSQYVAHVFGGRLQWVWVASALLLGLGGLVRESALGTAQFTLTLPFRRREWTKVRVTLGLMEAATLAVIPVLVIPLESHLIGHSYSSWEALKFSGLLLTGGSVFFFVGIFWSSLLPGEFSAVVAGGISVLLIFTAQDYLYRWVPSFNFPYFNMAALLGGYDFVNRATGFLTAWPWQGILKSLCASVALFWTSTEIIKHRDF